MRHATFFASAALLAAVCATPLANAQHCCSAETTHGWPMMTPEERKAHSDKMNGFKDAASCKAYVEQHDKAMAAKAKAQNKKPPASDMDSCSHLKK